MAAVFLLATSAVNAQTQKDFIRNYKAPDFKLRTLSAGLSGKSYRLNSSTTSFQSTLVGLISPNLNYTKISNSKSYQGDISLYSSFSAGFGKSSQDSRRYFEGESDFSHNGRFYLKDKYFIRSSTNANNAYIYSSHKNGSEADNSRFVFNISTLVSAGVGRVEYSNFARKAMDVQFLLHKADRSDAELSIEDLTKIANKLAEVTFTRGYDQRLLRVWRLEQMDELIGDLDMVSKRDMRYMAFLSDAMYNGSSWSRLSGSRVEMGIQQSALGVVQNAPVTPFSDRYISTVFIEYSKFVPKSYAIQHNFQLNLGASRVYVPNTSIDWSGRFVISYLFGWYPTTRTSLVARTSLSINENEQVSDIFGLRTSLDYHYYLSPRTRLQVEGNWINSSFIIENSGGFGLLLFSQFKEVFQ
jgi:hypothetical protein